MTHEAADLQRENAAPDADLTGRQRMAWNVLAGWGGYLAVAVTGFIMPRLTDGYLGQEALGLWDLGWSVVSYFSLAQLGVGGSVNRYVAKHRSAHDVPGLRRIASSAMCINLGSAALALVATAAAAWLAPWWFGDRLGEHADVARWVIILLGATVATEMGLAVFPGVLAGCHRWDLHNTINAAFEVATVAGMVATLYTDGGLRALALVALCGEIATEAARMVVAYRVCPELSVRLRYATWSEAKGLLSFGTKYFVGAISGLLLIQANNVIVATHLGPAALAAFARPLSLLRIVEAFVNRFAFVLTPMASSLQGGGRRAEIPALVIETARFGVALATPMILVLAILGQPVLLLWMGPRYQEGLVIAILALGFLGHLAQRPVMSILVGLNLHGRLALLGVNVAILGVVLGLLNAFVLGWKLVGAALAVGVPGLLGGLCVAIYACRQLDIPMTQYARQVFARPMVCAVPFALVLGASRLLFAHRPLVAVSLGLVTGALVIGPLYWMYLTPASVRLQIAAIASKIFSFAGIKVGV